jgi:hypothetical protein
LHSWSGIGLGKFPVPKLTEMIKKNNIALDRWRTTGALIIDESEWDSLLVIAPILIISIYVGRRAI